MVTFHFGRRTLRQDDVKHGKLYWNDIDIITRTIPTSSTVVVAKYKVKKEQSKEEERKREIGG